MFLTFKLSFNVDILTFLANFSKIGQNFKQFSGHTACQAQTWSCSLASFGEAWGLEKHSKFPKTHHHISVSTFQATTTTRCLHLPQNEEITELGKVAAASSAATLILTYYSLDATWCPSFNCRRWNWPKIWPLAPDSPEIFIYDKVCQNAQSMEIGKILSSPQKGQEKESGKMFLYFAH